MIGTALLLVHVWTALSKGRANKETYEEQKEIDQMQVQADKDLADRGPSREQKRLQFEIAQNRHALIVKKWSAAELAFSRNSFLIAAIYGALMIVAFWARAAGPAPERARSREVLPSGSEPTIEPPV